MCGCKNRIQSTATAKKGKSEKVNSASFTFAFRTSTIHLFLAPQGRKDTLLYFTFNKQPANRVAMKFECHEWVVYMFLLLT